MRALLSNLREDVDNLTLRDVVAFWALALFISAVGGWGMIISAVVLAERAVQ